MNNHDLFKKLTALHLSQEEKRFMRQNVLSHARERGILSPITSLFFFSRSFVTVTALALILLVGTTVVHGAEVSIPGDALYGMKRNINERVLGIFAMSDDAKARLETRFVDRRLEEIQKVIVREDTEDGKKSIAMDTDTAAPLSISSAALDIVESLTEEARTHAAKAKTHIENVNDTGDQDQALDLAADLELSIDVYASTLATYTQDDVENDTLLALADTVQVLSDSGEDVSALGDDIAIQITEDTETFDKEKVTEKLEEAEKLLATYKVNLVADELADFSATDMVIPEVEEETTEEEPAVPSESDEATVAQVPMLASGQEDLEGDAVAVSEAVVPTIEEETLPADSATVAETSDADTTVGVPTTYLLPTLADVETLLATCQARFDAGDYSQAYILCTEALQDISTLIEVREKIETDKEEPALSLSVADEAVVDDTSPTKEEVKERLGSKDIDKSTLTGKVLDALDQAAQ